MRNPYAQPNNTKVLIYAVIIALIAGVGFIVVQDINAPVEHKTQEIAVTLEK